MARVIDRDAFTEGPWMWWERQQAALTKADAIIALLIPPGHVVVPMEPTREMLNAAPAREDPGEESMYATIYRAMLAARRPAGEDKP